MTKHDCCHECPRCKYLTTCLPPCTGERKREQRVCLACQHDERAIAAFHKSLERYGQVYRALADASQCI